MALSPIVIEAIYKSTFGHLGNNPDARPIDIQRKIYERLNITDGGDRLRVLNSVRAAIKLWRDAEAVEPQSVENTPFAPTGRDPTVDDPATNYRYRTVIIIDPGDGGPLARYPVIVDSPDPMTPKQIRDEALDAYQNDGQRFARYDDRGAIDPSGRASVVITTGGRR